MADHLQLLQRLADGRFHSGNRLAQQLDLSRTAIWNGVERLRREGIDVFAVRGQGYRLEQPIELLDRESIMANLDADVRLPEQAIEVMMEVDSTNRLLLERAMCGAPGGSLCLAERQTAGRGRRGRSWVSPFGGNLYLSLLWRFYIPPSRLAGLSLAMAVSVARALREYGLAAVGVKWPNDLYSQGRKLGGILLEMAGEASGPCHVVVGLGLNVHLPAAAADGIDQPWTDLHNLLKQPVPRNRLAARIISEQVRMLSAFAERGPAAYLHQWPDYDVLSGQSVVVSGHQGNRTGVARGIADDGALLVEFDGVVQPVYSADVSVRPRQHSTADPLP